MAITLGGITLNQSLQWVDRHQVNSVAMSTKRALNGKLYIYSQVLGKGVPVNLEATEDTGWFDKSMVDDLIILASSEGSQYTLDFHGDTYTVMFNHEDPPAVEFIQLQYRVPHLSTDKFIGTVKLFTV